MVDPEMEEVEMAPGHTGPMVDRMDHALLDILLRLHRNIWAVEMLGITIDIIKVVIDTVVDPGHVVVLAHVPDYHVVNTLLLLLTGKETNLDTDPETDPEIDLEIEVDTEILVMAHLCHLLKDNIGMVATHHLHMDMVGMDLRMIFIVANHLTHPTMEALHIVTEAVLHTLHLHIMAPMDQTLWEEALLHPQIACLETIVVVDVVMMVLLVYLS